jgi:uncharacterized protein
MKTISDNRVVKTMTNEIRHNRDMHRFEITLNGQMAVLDYQQAGERTTFTHTGVPVQFRGQGIAAALTKAALDYAAEQELKVIPLCSYAAAFIDRHPEYQHLIG